MSDKDTEINDADKDSVENLTKEIIHLKDKIESMSKEQNSRAIVDKLRQYKNIGSTVALSVILGFVGILGAGHFYIGEKRKGIAFLISGIFLDFFIIISISIALYAGDQFIVASGMLLFFAMPYLALYIWQIFDSRKLCRKHNRRLDQLGSRDRIV